MRRRENLVKRAAAVAMMSALAVTTVPLYAFGYGEKSDYTNDELSAASKANESTDAYKTWLSDVWQAGASSESDSIALTPGSTEADLNFAWYSESKGTPAVKVWKVGEESSAKIFTGEATAISAENWQGSIYAASNKVCIEGYFVENTSYKYQYTDNYTGTSSDVWSDATDYKTSSTDSFSVILTGDPQIGASGSSDDDKATDSSIARDTYGWNKTMQTALSICPNAAFLLSAGDQIDKSDASKSESLKTRESEYAGYLYPSVFRSLPIASTIGNHDTAGVDYTQHFNNPNSSDNLGSTAAGSDYYFSYGDVLFISLNSNNRNQEEHRQLMTKAVESNPDAKWKVVIFHSDIYGSGQPHADTDAATNRIVLAPLMDEFDIDICLTGHDHTYSRSYQILDGNVIDYDISSGSVTDPEGTLYITTGSGSGSKYYNLLKYTPYYIAERTNDTKPAFSTIDFTSDSLTLKTYDSDGNEYASTFTIKKTTDEASVDDVIEAAEEKLSDTSVTYTDESKALLESALTSLKTLKASYTTAEDTMVAEISNNYNTSSDRIKGYGSIVNNEDKDLLSTGKYVNRLKRGLSTLLDKTIYTQIQDGEETANYKQTVPIVSSESIEEAKKSVVSAIAGLTLYTTDNTSDTSTETSTVASDTTPQTGDTNMAAVYTGVAAAALVVAGTVVYRKKKEEKSC